MGRLATWLAIVTVAFILLACAPPPELGDLRYIEAQRNCLTINMYDAGVDVFRSESAPPTEEEMQTAKEQCGEMGYQWVYTKRAFAEHITILGSRTADPSATPQARADRDSNLHAHSSDRGDTYSNDL